MTQTGADGALTLTTCNMFAIFFEFFAGVPAAGAYNPL